jgi:hypothetical protein
VFPGGDLGEAGGLVADGGQGQLAGGGADRGLGGGADRGLGGGIGPGVHAPLPVSSWS